MRPALGRTGSSTPSAERCSATASRYSRHGAHPRRWRRSGPRRSSPPRAVASCFRTCCTRLARLALGDQPAARLEHERLDLGRGHADHLADLRVGQVGRARQHERGALVLRQAPTSASSSRRSARRSTSGPRPSVAGSSSSSATAAGAGREHRAAAVARDREQPGAQLVGRAVRHQRAVGAQEGLLERVLGLFARAEQVAAEAEQRTVVAVVERLEGALVPGRRERGQALSSTRPRRARASGTRIAWRACGSRPAARTRGQAGSLSTPPAIGRRGWRLEPTPPSGDYPQGAGLHGDPDLVVVGHVVAVDLPRHRAAVGGAHHDLLRAGRTPPRGGGRASARSRARARARSARRRGSRA